MILPARKLVNVGFRGPILLHLHSIEVPGIEISALGVVHPRGLISIFGSLRAITHPVIEVCSDCRHFPVKLRTLLSCSFEDVSVNAEDRLVGPRVDLIELDHVYERCDIGPWTVSRITWFRV